MLSDKNNFTITTCITIYLLNVCSVNLIGLLSLYRQSYDIDMEIKVIGTSQMSRSSYDLKNPNFRYTGIQPQPPAGELIVGMVMCA